MTRRRGGRRGGARLFAEMDELTGRQAVMSQAAPQPPGQASAAGHRAGSESPLAVDRFLPRYDLAVVHSDVFRAPPEVTYQAVTSLDIFGSPLIRALIEARALPQRLRHLAPHRGTAERATPRPTFRLRDMTAIGWLLLDETAGAEIVLGQVSRPWKPTAIEDDMPSTTEQFAEFDRPGYAKIATSVRVDPYGSLSSIVTMETRVALTDDLSRRKFRRYWVFIGPFSAMTRRMAMRLLARELNGRD